MDRLKSTKNLPGWPTLSQFESVGRSSLGVWRWSCACRHSRLGRLPTSGDILLRVAPRRRKNTPPKPRPTDSSRQSGLNVYIVAGPNGAGKTTFARKFLPNYAQCRNFVNADLIAQGIAPFSPESVAFHAGRLMLQEIKLHAARREDFGFETKEAGLPGPFFLPDGSQRGSSVNQSPRAGAAGRPRHSRGHHSSTLRPLHTQFSRAISARSRFPDFVR